MFTTLTMVFGDVVNTGLDLEMSFNHLLEGMGMSANIAHLLWLPLPMLLVLKFGTRQILMK